MPIFDITITRTGGIAVQASTEQEARHKFDCMTIAEMEAHAQLTGWEASDAEEMEEKE